MEVPEKDMFADSDGDDDMFADSDAEDEPAKRKLKPAAAKRPAAAAIGAEQSAADGAAAAGTAALAGGSGQPSVLGCTICWQSTCCTKQQFPWMQWNNLCLCLYFCLCMLLIVESTIACPVQKQHQQRQRAPTRLVQRPLHPPLTTAAGPSRSCSASCGSAARCSIPDFRRNTCRFLLNMTIRQFDKSRCCSASCGWN